MLVLKYFLTLLGIGFLAGAGVILAFDLYQIFQQKRKREGEPLAGDGTSLPGEFSKTAELPEPSSLRWSAAAKVASFALIPLLLGMSITLVPDGMGAIRVSQFG